MFNKKEKIFVGNLRFLVVLLFYLMWVIIWMY